METSQPREAEGGGSEGQERAGCIRRRAADWGQSAGCFLRGTLTTADVTGRRAERRSLVVLKEETSPSEDGIKENTESLILAQDERWRRA